MQTLQAQELIKFTTSQLWDTLQPGNYNLACHDGTIQTNHKEILYSSYFWDFHRQYPQTPILTRHHVSYVLKGKPLNSDTHKLLLELVYWDTAEVYQMHTSLSRVNITKLIYEVTNNIYTDLSRRTGEYVSSIDILDFIAVIDHPPIKEQLDTVQPTEDSIRNCYNVILNELANSPELTDNNLAMASRAKMVNNNQVLQCVGPRGYGYEVDGFKLPVPTLRSFTKGMRSLYNQILESRSAAKSLYFSETPLQDTDYFARRLQLITTAVERIHHEDCGSTDFLIWRVNGEERQGDNIIYPGDLRFLEGKYYQDESGALQVIHENDHHLVGTTIKIRTVLGCKHLDNHGVCVVCFGQLSRNISPHANIGHICAATMTYQAMQSVLSTKHYLDGSGASEAIALNETARKFIRIGNKQDTIFINNEWRNKPLSMVVSQEEVFGLTDILLVDDIADINPSRISSIEMIEMMVDVPANQERPPRHPISVYHHSRRSMLSSEFLQYVKLHGWENDDNGNFVFDFDKWDFTKPVMLIPQKEYSYAKHASDISKIIESRVKDITGRAKPDSPKATLVELFELVNSKLTVNISCLEIIIYAMMCEDISNDNFNLTHHSPTPGLGISSLIIRNRSLSAAYAFEEQAEIINDPASFFKLNRADSIFDGAISPREVIEHYKRTH